MREQFIKGLVVLAEMCDKALSKEYLAMYDAELSEIGYDRLCGAVHKIIRTRKSRDGFPSISELAAAAGMVSDPNSEAFEAANRILEAIAKFGWNCPDEAKAFIGELGWTVVQRAGGWENVCAIPVKQVGFIRKQYFDMALMLYNRAADGKLGIAPGLPGAEQKVVDARNAGLINSNQAIGLLKGIGKAVPND